MGFEPEHVEHQHNPFMPGGELADFLAQPRKQRSLNMTPAAEPFVAIFRHPQYICREHANNQL